MIEEKSLGCISVGVEDDAGRLDLVGTRGDIVRVHEICGAVFVATLSFQVDARLKAGATGTVPLNAGRDQVTSNRRGGGALRELGRGSSFR